MARQPTFSNLQEISMILGEISAYEPRLNELGFELSLQPIEGEHAHSIAGQKLSKPAARSRKRSSNRSGPGNYWKIIAKIAKERGITKGEARKVYLQQKDQYDAKTGRKKPKTATRKTARKIKNTEIKAAKAKKAKFGKKMSGVMKAYHAEIERIMAKEKCDRPTARKIYAKNKKKAA